MRTVVSAKRCPECGKAAMLQAPSCSICGHRFRTRFVEPPVEKTEAFTLMVTPPVAVRPPPRNGASRTFRLAFLGSFLFVALAGGLLYLAWSARQPAGLLRVTPVSSALRPAPVSPALHLYEAIKPMMSLYDLDKTAGGMGRVVRVSDPYVLLLSYDYPASHQFPPQSVHVSLSRADLVSGDYQVQAVSLYQGKVLERHAGAE